MAKKLKLKLKPFQLYTLIEQDVVDGLEAGWNKAHKYTANPDEQQIFERQLEYIMLNLDERFNLK